MALSEIDRNLIKRCLAKKPQAWEDFVDRFMGSVVHVVNYTAQSRSMRLSAADREDLIGEVFLAIIDNDMAVLRHFRGDCSLATYLTVIARRVVVRKSLNMPLHASPIAPADEASYSADVEERIGDQEEVRQLLGMLHGHEEEVVRMYHLEGKSYGEISQALNMAENSIGPTLSRAKARLRRNAETS